MRRVVEEYETILERHREALRQLYEEFDEYVRVPELSQLAKNSFMSLVKDVQFTLLPSFSWEPVSDIEATWRSGKIDYEMLTVRFKAGGFVHWQYCNTAYNGIYVVFPGGHGTVQDLKAMLSLLKSDMIKVEQE